MQRMLRSHDRILTTHAGSLLRPKALTELFARASRGEPVDAAALAAEVTTATGHVVRQQLACGIDVGNDGEQARESFFTHVRTRLSGFGGRSARPLMRDLVRFPGIVERMLADLGRPHVSLLDAPQ